MHKPWGSSIVGEAGRVNCSEVPLPDCTVMEVEVLAVTSPTKSSIRSSEPDGAPVRGSVAAVATLVALKFRASVPLVRVSALFRFKFNETPVACPLVSVRGNGEVATCAEPAVKTIWQI